MCLQKILQCIGFQFINWFDKWYDEHAEEYNEDDDWF